MKAWFMGLPWVRWPHKDDARTHNEHGERLLLLGDQYWTVKDAQDVATAIIRLLMEDAASKAERG